MCRQTICTPDYIYSVLHIWHCCVSVQSSICFIFIGPEKSFYCSWMSTSVESAYLWLSIKPVLLVRTQDNMMMSLSPPWKASTVETRMDLVSFWLQFLMKKKWSHTLLLCVWIYVFNHILFILECHVIQHITLYQIEKCTKTNYKCTCLWETIMQYALWRWWHYFLILHIQPGLTFKHNLNLKHKFH